MLNRAQIEKSLKTNLFGRNMFLFTEIDSTNNNAMQAAREGAPEGTIFLADFQRAGKGRMGSTWHSAKGKNILMSIILRPRASIESVQRITLATADILIHVFEIYFLAQKFKQPEFEVKWPNDILIDGRKVCGILTESSIKDREIEFLVIGIGINVNQEMNAFDPSLRETSISLLDKTGKKINREKLIGCILSEFEISYFHWELTDYSTVIEDWKKHWRQIGSYVKIELPFSNEYGYIQDIDKNGILIYRTESGEIKQLLSGSISKEMLPNVIND